MASLLPRLPSLLISLTVLLPGNRHRSMPLTLDPTFPFLSQRPCVEETEAAFLSSAEPRDLKSLTRHFALLSLPLNFLHLPPTSPPPLPLAQTTFLSPFRMGLTNPDLALGRFSLVLISLKLLTVSGIPPFSTNSFQLTSFLALLVGLNLSVLIGALAWFIKITKAAPFESIEVFRKDPFLALYFSLSSSIIFWPLCFHLSAALFTLTIWPFGPPPRRSPLRLRPHKELCFDWSADLSTDVFLSIQANVRSSSSQWISTKLTSSPTSSYSAPASVSIPLQLFLGSPSTALFLFLNMYLR